MQCPLCPKCGAIYGELCDNYYDREIIVQVQKSKATKWPDVSPCGTSFLLLSRRVLEVWEGEGIGTIPSFPVRVIPPFPKTLLTEPPMYYRLDYKKMVGVELDFEASGYINARACEFCGRFLYDDTPTYINHRTKIYPEVFKPETWNGAHVFCPKMPERIMFCTDKVVDCAHKYKLTNFEFTPIEIANSASGFKGVDYSKKNWRQKLPEQIRKYEEYFYSLPPLSPDFAEQVTTAAEDEAES